MSRKTSREISAPQTSNSISSTPTAIQTKSSLPQTQQKTNSVTAWSSAFERAQNMKSFLPTSAELYKPETSASSTAASFSTMTSAELSFSSSPTSSIRFTATSTSGVPVITLKESSTTSMPGTGKTLKLILEGKYSERSSSPMSHSVVATSSSSSSPELVNDPESAAKFISPSSISTPPTIQTLLMFSESVTFSEKPGSVPVAILKTYSMRKSRLLEEFTSSKAVGVASTNPESTKQKYITSYTSEKTSTPTMANIGQDMSAESTTSIPAYNKISRMISNFYSSKTTYKAPSTNLYSDYTLPPYHTVSEHTSDKTSGTTSNYESLTMKHETGQPFMQTKRITTAILSPSSSGSTSFNLPATLLTNYQPRDSHLTEHEIEGKTFAMMTPTPSLELTRTYASTSKRHSRAEKISTVTRSIDSTSTDSKVTSASNSPTPVSIISSTPSSKNSANEQTDHTFIVSQTASSPYITDIYPAVSSGTSSTASSPASPKTFADTSSTSSFPISSTTSTAFSSAALSATSATASNKKYARSFTTTVTLTPKLTTTSASTISDSDLNFRKASGPTTASLVYDTATYLREDSSSIGEHELTSLISKSYIAHSSKSGTKRAQTDSSQVSTSSVIPTTSNKYYIMNQLDEYSSTTEKSESTISVISSRGTVKMGTTEVHEITESVKSTELDDTTESFMTPDLDETTESQNSTALDKTTESHNSTALDKTTESFRTT